MLVDKQKENLVQLWALGDVERMEYFNKLVEMIYSAGSPVGYATFIDLLYSYINYEPEIKDLADYQLGIAAFTTFIQLETKRKTGIDL